MIEDIKNIATIEANFVVDTIWNVIIQPILPQKNVFTLSSDLQNLLNQILSPSVASNSLNMFNQIVSPYSTGLPSTQFNIPSVGNTISTLTKTYGIFSILFDLGGKKQVEWAMEDLSNRIASHFASYIENIPPNQTAFDNFVNQNSNILSYQAELTNYANNNLQYVNGLNFYSPLVTQSTPLIAGIVNIPRGLDLKELENIEASEIQNLEGGISGETSNLATLGYIGIAIGLAMFTLWLIATILTIGNLLSTSLTNLSNWANLPSLLTSSIAKSQSILWAPQTAFDNVLGSNSWVQAAKMGNDVFSIVKSSYFSSSNDISLALQTAKLIVFGLGGFYETYQLNINTAHYQGVPIPSMINSPIQIKVNFISSLASIAGNFASWIGSYISYSGSSTKLGTLIHIFCLGFSIALQIAIYYPQRGNSFASKMFFTSIAGKALSSVSLVYKISKKVLTPKMILILTATSWEADIFQFGTYLNNL